MPGEYHTFTSHVAYLLKYLKLLRLTVSRGREAACYRLLTFLFLRFFFIAGFTERVEKVAKVLKPSDVEQDLVPAMEAFLRDMEEVRVCMSALSFSLFVSVCLSVCLSVPFSFPWRHAFIAVLSLPCIAMHCSALYYVFVVLYRYCTLKCLCFVFLAAQVRLGVIRHLGDFFQEMSSQGRERHLNVLVEVMPKDTHTHTHTHTQYH